MPARFINQDEQETLQGIGPPTGTPPGGITKYINLSTGDVYVNTNGVWTGPGLGPNANYVTVVRPSGDATGATDTAAIQAAINAFGGNGTAGGGTVRLAAGTFYVTNIQMDLRGGARIKIAGEGQATKVINVAVGGGSTATSTFYVIGATTITVDGPIAANWFEIADMELVGSATCGAAVYLSDTYQGQITNLYIHDFTGANGWGVGIALSGDGAGGTIETTIVNPLIVNCTTAAIWATRQFGNINNIMGGWLYNCGTGFLNRTSGGNNNFFGTVFQKCTTGIDDNNNTSYGTNYYGCWIENNTVGASLNSPNGFGSLLDGCVFALNVTDIAFQASSKHSIIRKPRFLTANPVVTVALGAQQNVIEDAGDNFVIASVTDNSAGVGLILRDNSAINPVGVVAPAVPASGVAVPAAMYDRTFYVTAGVTSLSMAIQNGPTITVPASALGAVRVPAGKTVTPTYANVPTWVVEGE